MTQNIILKIIKERCKSTLVSHLGIEITYADREKVEGKMPVDERTCQPYGVLHGGASVAFSETLGSIGGQIAAGEQNRAMGQQINSNHIRPVKKGYVTGVAKIIHKGKKSQLWEIKVFNEEKKLICNSQLTLAIL
ncbi:MAG: thioesterase [Gammaproteobacteria bacterium]|nr:MAG: thioesterase [Gammaproteobacteria bacterium]